LSDGVSAEKLNAAESPKKGRKSKISRARERKSTSKIAKTQNKAYFCTLVKYQNKQQTD